MADFLLALADFDRRRLWLGLGYTSLFYFLHRELKLSAGAAFHRKSAAELLQRFPEVVEPLRDGRLCLSSVVELSRVITPENVAEVLPRFFHASKQEAKAVAAELAPRELLPQRVVVTAVAQAGAAASHLTEPGPPVPTAAALGRSFHLDETRAFPASAAGSAIPPRARPLPQSGTAGSCCDRQWIVPSPQTRSRAWMPDDRPVLEEVSEDPERLAVGRIVEGRHQDRRVGDVEVGVARRQPLAVEDDRPGHGQVDDLGLRAVLQPRLLSRSRFSSSGA